MARELFVDEKLNSYLKDELLALLDMEPTLFKKAASALFFKTIKSKLKELLPDETLNRIYYLGSFSREEPTLYSDLDLLYFGDEVDVSKINESLRTVFRKYSVKRVVDLNDFFFKTDPKGLLSAWSAHPIFKGKEILSEVRRRGLIEKKEEALNFILNENIERRKRYGDRPGKLNCHLKNSPGGVIDLYQAEFLNTAYNRESGVTATERAEFYQLRVRNQMKSGSDTVKLEVEQGFLKRTYETMWSNFQKLEKARGAESFKLNQTFEKLGFQVSSEEWDKVKDELYKMRGVVSSPSYHIHDVASHLEAAVSECSHFISLYEEEFKITGVEKECLLWAALFHDIKKGDAKRKHSELGAEFTQLFGEEFGWSPLKTEMVSWLVREHLTLVRHAFKTDPYEEQLLKQLSVKGCSGRRAVMLFVLSCADIKATNPTSWNKWKEEVLRKVLNRLLGVEEELKEKLLLDCPQSAELIEKLTIKELSFVPYDVLKKDLSKKLTEGFQVYANDEKIWLRCYFERDQDDQLAEKLLTSLDKVGVYIHHAFFKTFKSTEEVYNWICVESGVTRQAFLKRFEVIFNSSSEFKNNNEQKSDVTFTRIRRNLHFNDYAVISFRGGDGNGVLLEAIRVLKESGLKILWGHAVTWGNDIEDVFGVTWSSPVDWTFLSEKEPQSRK